MARFPDAKLYGPYAHGGRSYYQWMARGRYLRDFIVPLLELWWSWHEAPMRLLTDDAANQNALKTSLPRSPAMTSSS